MNATELKFWTNDDKTADSVASAYCKYRGWDYANGKTISPTAFIELKEAAESNCVIPEHGDFITFYRCPNNQKKVMTYISNKNRWTDYVGMYGICWLAELDCDFMIDSVK